MPSNGTISVIIPTYNRCELLKLTLNSLKNQTIDKNLFEVLIVDDGSTDATAEIIDSFCNYLNIKYLFQEDRGYRAASARNLGIVNSRNDILLFVDSGMLLSSYCINAHLKSHKDSDNKVVLGYMLGLESKKKIDPEFVSKIISNLDPDKAIEYLSKNGYRDSREEVYEMCNSNLNKLPAPWALFWTGNISVKKKRILDVDLFDSNFDLHWGIEDIELGYRLFLKNLIFIVNREASSIHIPHFSDSEKKKEDEFLNKLYFYYKYPSLETRCLLVSNTISINSHLLCKSP